MAKKQHYMQEGVEAARLEGTAKDIAEINTWLLKRGVMGEVLAMPGGEFWYRHRGRSDIQVEKGDFIVLGATGPAVFDPKTFGKLFHPVVEETPS